MNLKTHNSNSGGAPRTNALVDVRMDGGSAEQTLRLIARLSAPAGLEDRVIARLDSAPRRGRLLHWPAMLQPGSGWMRGAAAAAIVFVVAGGGWGIYTNVQQTQAAKVIAMPRAGAGGGFSSAGAMRTPQTLQGPVVAEPVTGQTARSAKTEALQPVLVKPPKKAPAKVVPMAKPHVGSKAPVAPAVSAVK